ncbi:NACHT domain-containing protein [Sphingobium sufflavum]|uniref:NACHT domain-containing protein n=1 Tax=Sphingobium sufflavum TaxID=1129547 RepID=UPI001F256958|nr:NACHT domain-containing protein [Sphingobium sufflavum]MCE7796052.1 NACHT domain-containing protein [Sphingobium sufflavum]
MATPILKMLAPQAIKGVASALTWGRDKVLIHFTDTFRDHLEATKRKCSAVRTINFPDHLTKINDIYVNLYVTSDGNTVRDEDILEILRETGLILIKGTAGAGKTMLMRSLALRALTDEIPQVPLFIDLRDMANPSDLPILDSIFDLVTPENQRGNREVFDEALKSGGFCLFLDGVDEVPPQHRIAFREQVERLTVRFPKLQIILSSRPDVDFSGWEGFYTMAIEPLTKDQTILLIEKVPFQDEEAKEEFLKKLKEGDFDDRTSFLQIPLLAVLLLMCYGEHLQLGETTTAFYDQAFEVLYRRHDRTKGLRRKHFCDLPADRFRAIFAAFCYKSLADHKVSFTEDEVVRYVSKASEIQGIEIDHTDFHLDMIESVSMLQRD